MHYERTLLQTTLNSTSVEYGSTNVGSGSGSDHFKWFSGYMHYFSR